jgi:hypothetical protein
MVLSKAKCKKKNVNCILYNYIFVHITVYCLYLIFCSHDLGVIHSPYTRGDGEVLLPNPLVQMIKDREQSLRGQPLEVVSGSGFLGLGDGRG